MQSLLIEVDGRVLRFDTHKVIKIGRSIEADVVLAAGSVSRTHAELRPGHDGWVIADIGSALGTYVDGNRITETRIAGRTNVQCGPPAAGSTLTITPEHQAAPELAAPSMPPAPAPAPVDPNAWPQSAASGPGGYSMPPQTPTPGGSAPGGFGPGPQSPGAVPSTAGPGQQGDQSGGAFDQTFILAAQRPGPPGMGGPARSGPDLLVVAEGREYRYRHPAQISIGRLPECDIVINDPVASRHHGQISATPGGWIFQNGSNEGSFVEGRRVENEAFTEALELRLGHPVAGPEVKIVPILSAEEEERRFAKKRRNRRLKLAGAVTAAAVVVAGTVTAAVLLGGGSGGGNENGGEDPDTDTMAALTSKERDAAKAATVFISYEVETEYGSGVVTGSGSIIDGSGLILTNAHVAAPTAEGLEEIYGPSEVPEDPEYVLISLTDGEDFRTNEPDYRARVVEADGDLDAAVIEIYEDADGGEIDPEELDLPTMPIGDDDELSAGDDVTLLGFPAIARSSDIDPSELKPAVTVTTGVIATFLDTDRLGERSEIDTDARIAGGNSGGAAVDNDDKLIGVPSAISGPQGSPVVSGRIRPINYLIDMIDEAKSEVGSN